MKEPDEQLRELEANGLLRTLRPLESSSGLNVSRNGKSLWNFASNDYLGLASHPSVNEAFHEGLERWGHGSAASRLITGSQPPHCDFEDKLAAAKGTESSLFHSSGFSCAVGSIPAIVAKGDYVILDKLSHASLIDGAKLSGAKLRVFRHNDATRLEKLLKAIRSKDTEGRILIITESVFSMDGDLCALPEIIELKDKYNALLWLDEAHGFGVLGETGMGLAEELNLQNRVDFQMGTLSKAAGLAGAYVACSRPWTDLFVNRARSFIYSTATPPALAYAASRSLEIIRSNEGNDLRSRLSSHVAQINKRAQSPIIPIILGENRIAIDVSNALEAKGYLVPAIRYPTVPRNSARLRISVSARHSHECIVYLMELLEQLIPRGTFTPCDNAS